MALKANAVIVAAVLTLAVPATHCSKHPVIADIGPVDFTNGVPVFRQLDRNKRCTIIPTILTSNRLRLDITIRTTPIFGKARADWTRVDIKADRTNQISIGDNFDIRLAPRLSGSNFSN